MEQSAKIGHETRKAKNKAGKEKVYKINVIRLPELVRSFFNDYVYIYDMDGTSYITSDEPAPIINFCKRKIFSKESRISLSDKVFPISDDDTEFVFRVNMNRYDYVTGKRGLVEVCVR